MNLKGKKVLLLAPSFYGYYKAIKNEIEKNGAKVYLILEVCDPLYLYIFRKNRLSKYLYSDFYYRRELSKINDNVDYVFLIRGEALSPSIIKYVSEKFHNPVKIMYQWDSVKNNPNAKMIADCFDIKYTFDPNDSKNLGWNYRPLFYLDQMNKRGSGYSYDFVFVGTLYYRRAKLLNELKKFCSNHGYTIFSYMFVKKFEYYFHRVVMRDSKYLQVDRKDIHFKGLSSDEVARYYNQSRIIVDYAADGQDGLTMRTIESIGSRCKIITNNKNVYKEDFYTPENIYIYDLENFNIPNSFIDTEYMELSAEIYEKYSLSGWIDEIFEGKTND